MKEFNRIIIIYTFKTHTQERAEAFSLCSLETWLLQFHFILQRFLSFLRHYHNCYHY